MKQEDINCYTDQLIQEAIDLVLLDARNQKTEKIERMFDRVDPAILEEYIGGPVLDSIQRLWKRK